MCECTNIFSNILRQFGSSKDTIIHKYKYKNETLFLIHQFFYSPYDGMISGGRVYLLFRASTDANDTVLEYKVIRKRDGHSFIDLSKVKLPESYRGIGIGCILLRYFESIIAREYLKDIKLIKGITIIGDFSLKRFYERNGYKFNNYSVTKEIN